jgi:hypothetical protein
MRPPSASEAAANVFSVALMGSGWYLNQPVSSVLSPKTTILSKETADAVSGSETTPSRAKHAPKPKAMIFTFMSSIIFGLDIRMTPSLPKIELGNSKPAIFHATFTF